MEKQRPAPVTTGERARGFVARPALVQRLEAGTARAVTLVAGSAGSGKTVLVRSWLESRGSAQRSAWVAVERGERDAQRFWSAVVDALEPVAGATIVTPTPVPSFDGDAAVRRLVSDLDAAEGRILLVIDDLHEIASVEIESQLTYLLDHLPRSLHLVLLTRRDPQLGLYRRQLDGGVTEVRNAQLQFSLQETRELLSGLGMTLADESVGLLHDRTEGWVAGLRLAAIPLATHPDPERFVAEFSGSDRTVAEYLLAEVLDSQPPDVRRLLTRASLLEQVNGPLGDLLTGTAGTERHLRALADDGGFVIALDASRTWFRLHNLFADLLAVELRHAEPDAVPRLHRAAAQWHAEHGDVVEAITHAQAAGDRRHAAQLLVAHYFSLTLDGRRATAHALLGMFPPAPTEPTPELSVVTAAEQLTEGSLEEAAAHLALAERHADAVPVDRRHRFDMALFVTRLSLARRLGDFRSVADAVEAVRLAEPHDGRDIAMNADVRASMLLNLGIVETWSGRPDEGAEHLAAAGELARRSGRPYLEVSAQAHWAHAASWGSFTRAREAAREAIALAADHGWADDEVTGPALVTLGAALIHAGRLDEGEDHLTRAGDTLRSELEPAVGFVLHMARGAAHIARGRHADAIASYRAAERLGVVLVTGSPLEVQLRSSTLHAMLGLGEVDAVREALARMTEAERAGGELREILATLALAEGDAQGALDVLESALDGSAEVHHPTVVVRCLLRSAIAHDELGERLAAEAAVERALDLAEPDALILPFVHAPSRPLLERHPRHRTAHGAFIAEILDALSGRSLPEERVRAGAPIEALSNAELRVLRFLPTNLSASAIAAELYVSANTVKTHMRHIYAKLDGHSRVEAVERARDVGLLGQSSRHG